MRRARYTPLLLLFSLCAIPFSLAQEQGPSLQLLTRSLPEANLGRPYNATIELSGGTPPLRWQIVAGKLPPGIALGSNSGVVSGTPTRPGISRFTVAISDATGKRIVHDFTIAVEDYLTVKFKEGPTLNSNVLSGSVEVKNGSKENYDLTVIVVAINPIGKAFALGYQHFTLSSLGKQTIPYSSLLPNGNYAVHVDAIAKVAGRNLVRYASLQTPPTIVVNVNR